MRTIDRGRAVCGTIAAAAMVLLIAGCGGETATPADATIAPAPPVPPGPQRTATVAAAGDSRYLGEALRVGMAHIALAQDVMRRSESPVVDRIAREVIETHQAMNEDLRRIAAAHAVPIPSSPSPELEPLAQRLRTLRGRELDVAYLQALIDRYPELVRFHNVASTTATDMTVKEAAVRSEAMFEGSLRPIHAAYAELTGAAPPLPPEGGSPPPARGGD